MRYKIKYFIIKKAFTLAEVLIVIGIIGIIAKLTIPTLLQKVSREETIVALKKTYSELSQSVKLSEVDNGNPSTWNWGLEGSEFTAANSFNTYWKPYLRTPKICPEYTDCGYKNSHYKIGNNFDGYRITTAESRTLFTLPDGIIVFIISNSTDENGNPSPSHRIFIDTNGAKNPNKIGVDVFVFDLTQEGFVPYGKGFGNRCANNAYYCTSKIMEDGWKFSDDYPWK